MVKEVYIVDCDGGIWKVVEKHCRRSCHWLYLCMALVVDWVDWPRRGNAHSCHGYVYMFSDVCITVNL